jgi:hypothetical protein
MTTCCEYSSIEAFQQCNGLIIRLFKFALAVFCFVSFMFVDGDGGGDN